MGEQEFLIIRDKGNDGKDDGKGKGKRREHEQEQCAWHVWKGNFRVYVFLAFDS